MVNRLPILTTLPYLLLLRTRFMLSIDQLLNPINDASPCGEDLSFSRELDEIAEAQRADDPTLDQGEWVTALKESDWGLVVKRCTDLLETRSKDLRLAVWLAEAAAKTGGFRDLGDGYRVVAGLCDRYWDGLYPVAEDGDQERRVGNLSWLLKRSVPLVREIPLTEGKGSAYSAADFEAAQRRAAAAAKIAAEGGKPDEGVKLSVLEAAKKKSSRGFYEKLLGDARYCLESLVAMEAAVDARLGADGPGFSTAKLALESVLATVERYAGEAGVAKGDGSAPAQMEDGVATGQTEVNEPGALAGPIQTRAQALNQLRLVADFFRRTEPHSPVAYLADKAARWGDTSLHDWLRMVIKDGASLAHVEELLGLSGDGQNPGSDQ